MTQFRAAVSVCLGVALAALPAAARTSTTFRHA